MKRLVFLFALLAFPVILGAQTPDSTKVLFSNAIPYYLVDTKPCFEGESINKFTNWMINHMNVRDLKEEDKLSSRITLQILLSEEGIIIGFENFEETDFSPLEKAYIAAAKGSPQWTPAMHNGKPCKVIIPIISIIDLR